VYDEEKGVMFCQTCRKYPSLVDKSSPLFSGTSNFRIDPLKSHQRSREHEACGMRIHHESKERTTTELKDMPLGKALLKVGEHQKKRLRFLFNTAYAAAKKGKLFSDFEYICELQIKVAPYSFSVREEWELNWHKRAREERDSPSQMTCANQPPRQTFPKSD